MRLRTKRIVPGECFVDPEDAVLDVGDSVFVEFEGQMRGSATVTGNCCNVGRFDKGVPSSSSISLNIDNGPIR